MRTFIIAASGLAFAMALSPVSESQAASLIGPGSRLQADSLAQQVKAKKRHRMHRKGRHAHSKGPGRCGENMYWSRKGCMDARTKA